MAAGVVHRLGVFIGSDWTPGVFEDQHMRLALYHFFHDKRASTILQYNTAFQKWGFKFPSIHNHMFPSETGQFRSPRFIIMWRDAISVAQRANVEEYRIIQEQALMAQFARSLSCPVMMVSYEKAMLQPAAFVAAVAAFIGVKMDNAAINLVGDNAAYLSAPHE